MKIHPNNKVKKIVLYFKKQEGLLVALILGISILFLIAFQWKENLDLKFKINDQKIANYFASVASVATIVSLNLIYKQLQEMKRSTDASSTPNVRISASKFKMSDVKGVTFGNNFNSKIHVEVHSVVNGQILTNELAFINIQNVGFGPAINTKIKWLYDFSEVANLVKNTYSMPLSSNDQQSLDIINKDQMTKIFAPFDYLICCGQQLNPTIVDFLNPPVQKKPSLRLQLTFQNIHWREYMSEFQVNIHALNDEVIFNFEEIISIKRHF